MTALATVHAYHQRSKHRLQRYAAGPDTLDWEAQPNPWRRYAGAPLLPLPLLHQLPQGSLPATWPQLFEPDAVPARPLDSPHLAALLQLSLGLAAWKQQGPDRWAVRCNPSSGNLHPTEAYVLARGLPDLADGLYHYAPREPALEQRAQLAPGGAPGLWLGLSSIHWREAWKYGERAFRYCQLDLGHALGALRYAAALLGWRLRIVPGIGSAGLAALLGLDRTGDFGTAELEEPELLLQVQAEGRVAGEGAGKGDQPAPQDLHGWAGQANRLDARPMYRWPVIDEVAAATRWLALPPAGQGGSAAPQLPLAQAMPADAAAPNAATLIQQRRSAQRFDRRATMSAAVLQRLVAALQPAAGLPWDVWPWAPRIHPVFFLHRVEGFAPGAYLLPRHADAPTRLAAATAPGLLWQALPGTPLLRLADNPALAGTLRTLCCHQALAADANIAVAMLGEFDRTLAEAGAAGYRQLLQEAGLMGQALYLEAEAGGHRGTGIGCFFDDALHELLGISGSVLQTLYHFTLGTALEDPRIGTEPAYSTNDASSRSPGDAPTGATQPPITESP